MCEDWPYETDLTLQDYHKSVGGWWWVSTQSSHEPHQTTTTTTVHNHCSTLATLDARTARTAAVKTQNSAPCGHRHDRGRAAVHLHAAGLGPARNPPTTPPDRRRLPRRPCPFGRSHGRPREGVVAVRGRRRTIYVRPGVQGVHHGRCGRQRAAARPAREREHQGAADPPQHRDGGRLFVGRPREHFLQHQRGHHGDGRHARVPARLSADERDA